MILRLIHDILKVYKYNESFCEHVRCVFFFEANEKEGLTSENSINGMILHDITYY